MKRFLLSFIVVAVLQVDVRAQVYGNPVYTWDFANGIPDGWEQELLVLTTRLTGNSEAQIQPPTTQSVDVALALHLRSQSLRPLLTTGL